MVEIDSVYIPTQLVKNENRTFIKSMIEEMDAMKKKLTTLATIVIFSFSFIPSIAGTYTEDSSIPLAAQKNKKVISAICPVSGAYIPDVSKAPKSVYKGKTYYFCCDSCKSTFDKNPEKYIKNIKK
jgi:YHS domain-containing protein